ncbi:SDR family oxidoreductase [Sphingobium tyrosinilyticum]|uniref:SDR family oxidoreductase n=1 Tax=Sphingobium tyrosinilyticum TaxID=2715436 RepID=A0ABV9F1H9_9SPHN
MTKSRLAGKRALVTAAAAGIGWETALIMAREGAEVLATDIDEAGLASLPKEVQRERLDVIDTGAAAALLERHGAFDILVNAAGYVHAGTILDCDEDAWNRSVTLNMTAMFRIIKASLPGMIANGGGSIVNIASVASSVRSVPNRFAYSATKAGVIGLTKSVAADFVTQGIRCNAVCPGTVDTPSLRQRLRDTGDEEAAFKAFSARQPMGRLGRAEEIASLILYLASDEAAFTTGAIHVIDGGWAN